MNKNNQESVDNNNAISAIRNSECEGDIVGEDQRISTETTVATTETVCCGCRPKAEKKTKKYRKEPSQQGWLRVFHFRRGTSANIRRYKESYAGDDSVWTAFHAHHHSHHHSHNQEEGAKSHKSNHDNNNNESDNNDSDESMFFFDAVDRQLGDDEYPVDGYAIGGPNAKVVFTTSMQHPTSPHVTFEHPSTLLRRDQSPTKTRTNDRITDVDNDNNDIPSTPANRREAILNHLQPSARFRRIQKLSPHNLEKELKSPTSKMRKEQPHDQLADAIGLAGYPGTLTVEELAECQKFLQGLQELSPTISEQVYSFRDIEEEPYTICRWLRATKFNAEEILQRLQDNQAMFDEAKQFQFYGPNIEDHLGCPLSVFLSQYPFLPIGRGKNGCPVNYFLAGKIQPEGILCVTSIEKLAYYFWYSFMYKMKVELQEAQYIANNSTTSSSSSNTTTTTTTTSNNKHDNDDDDDPPQNNNYLIKCEGINILDLAGLSASSLTSETMEVIKLSSKISDFFPETLHCMLIINAPSFFSFSWKIIKKFIDPRTVSRIQVFSNKEKGQLALEKLIDKHQDIPTDYGGTNATIGNCQDALHKEISDPTILKQEIELVYTRNYINHQKSKSTKKLSATSTPLLKSWFIKEQETMDITIYTRSVSEADICVLFNGTIIKTVQAQCRFGGTVHGVVAGDDGNDTGDDDKDMTTPFSNRIVVSNSSQEVLMVGPGEIIVTAEDLDSPLTKQKPYSSLSRGYFLVVGDVKKIVDTPPTTTTTTTTSPAHSSHTTPTTTSTTTNGDSGSRDDAAAMSVLKGGGGGGGTTTTSLSSSKSLKKQQNVRFNGNTYSKKNNNNTVGVSMTMAGLSTVGQ